MSPYPTITPAQIDWQQQLPVSNTFQDVYFSRAGGLAETHYVFLEGNRLAERWQQCCNFTIAETGFGTGLNFLCAAQAWLNTQSKGCLHFISAEKHPLTQADLQRALQLWPELATLSEQLINLYPKLVAGFHQLDLIAGRIRLTLLFGDATEQFTQLQASVDAWFLDGFSPDKNPDMWSDSLYKQIKRLSKVGTTFATFTAAGHVKRALMAQGFQVDKRKGFGQKREMLTGALISPPLIEDNTPWFRYPSRTKTQHTIIIGGGLAGCSTAFALAQQQIQATLIEARPALAQAASGNHTGVLMPRLSRNMSLDSQFYLHAFLYSCRVLAQIKHPSWYRSGVIQLADEVEQAALAKLNLAPEILQICNTQQASQLAGVTLSQGGLYFPLAGYLSPPALCQHLIELAQAEIMLNTHVTELRQQPDHWQVWQQQQLIAEAETVILCNGYQASELLIDSSIYPLVKTRGQLTYLADSQQASLPICYDGYLIPAYDGIQCCGTTYSTHDQNPELSDLDQQQILDQLQQTIANFRLSPVIGGRVAFRTASTDYLPLVGPVADIDFYRKNYADLHHGRPAKHFPAAKYLNGLYLNTGHGSRGLTSCLLSAELLAAHLSQQALPLTRNLTELLHPARFLVRQLKRRIYDTPTKP